MNLAEHPTVKRFQNKVIKRGPEDRQPLDAAWLREIILAAGADDVGFVEIGRPEIDEQRQDILNALPSTKSLISFVVRMNHEPIRTPARSVSNLEFHHTGDKINEIGQIVVRKLENVGVRSLNPAMGFPMEIDKFPGKIWIVSHKPVAVAAGLGMMGIHRNVIHEKFGNFILLGTVLIDTEVSQYGKPIDYNPCLGCKLCVAACPVGAISSDGAFNFSACYTHNYREFMGGFTDWIEQVADSDNAKQYRSKVRDNESASMWQSLSYGANYKAAYCLSVCPAGDDVIGPYLTSKKTHLEENVKPLQAKKETIYVLKNSDAEQHVASRFPNKIVKQVNNSLRPRTIDQLLGGLPLVFQPNKSEGIDARYHFEFTGDEQRKATIVIRNKKIQIEAGHQGDPDLLVAADTKAWLGFLAKEKSLVWALLLRKIRLRGSPILLVAFGNCFPK